MGLRNSSASCTSQRPQLKLSKSSGGRCLTRDKLNQTDYHQPRRLCTKPYYEQTTSWWFGTMTVHLILFTVTTTRVGLTMENDQWIPVMTTLSPAPKAIIQLVKCICAKERCSTNRCRCRKAGLLSKIKRIRCVLLYLMKRPPKSLQVLIQSGLCNDWTCAMPSSSSDCDIATAYGNRTWLSTLFLMDVHLRAFARAMHHCPIWSKQGPWNYRELVETDSLFDVNIWAILANHHRPRKQRPVLFKFHRSLYCLNFDHLPITFPCL